MNNSLNSLIAKVLLFASSIFLSCLISNTGYSQWSQTNGPQGSEIEHISYNGTNILYAQTYNYIYRSYNNGNLWTLLKCPSKSPYYLKAKNEMVFVVDGNGGIYRSTNEGDNWNYVSELGNILINSITFYNDSVYISVSSGIYASNDKGETWTLLPVTYGTNYAGDIFFVGTRLYATSIISNTSNFLRSLDFGRTWTKLDSSGIPGGKFTTSFIYGNGTFYAGLVYDGVYKSTDNCKSWSKIISTPDVYEVFVRYGNGKLYAYSLDTLYSSANSGNTWSTIDLLTPHHSISCIEFKRNTMFAGFYFPGVYRSTNGGQNWIPAYNGMKELNVSGLITIGNYVYASHNGTGMSRTTGTQWQKYSGDLTSDFISAICLDSNYLYAGSVGDLYRSANNGLNWSVIYDGSRTTSISCVNANKGNIYYGTSRRGLYFSTDNGAAWSNVSGSSGITSIVSLNEYVFYSTHNTHSAPSGSVYRSSDNGQTWINVTIPNTPRPQTALLEKHNGNIFGVSKSDLYKSTNFGLNWIKYQAGFEDSTFTSIYSNKGILYCGTSSSGGKYYLRKSTDDGLTFQKIGDSLPAEVNFITIKGNYIYAGLDYYGVWRISKSFITSENNFTGVIPDSYSLEQNYPNPFNPSTKVQFSIVNVQYVILKIYDVLGKEIATLVNEKLAPGTYSVDWNASGYTSGVYFYKLTLGGFSDTKRMVLVK